MSTTTKYAVFGAGSWATAIVKMLCENLDEVGCICEAFMPKNIS